MEPRGGPFILIFFDCIRFYSEFHTDSEYFTLYVTIFIFNEILVIKGE